MMTSWKHQLQDWVEMWISPENRKLTILWGSCVAGVIALSLYMRLQTSSFVGIADSRESFINFEFPVTLRRIHVLPGQEVHKGDLLVELDQPELEMKMHAVRTLLEKLRAERGLKRELGRLATKTLERDVVVDGTEGFDPLGSEIGNLEKELRVLENRERNLYVFADISGVVGSVNFKRGERVAPYATIMTVSPNAPTYVQGFIHESLHSQVTLGQKMQISSVADSSKTMEGRVVSVGSRIVELPHRLGRTQVPVWGREVSLEIVHPETASAPFLLGEKVQIQPAFFSLRMNSAQAEELPETKTTLPAAARDPELMSVPENVRIHSKFEPSGAVYLPDLHKFAVVSDDTDEGDSPFLFLVNGDGSVEPNLLRVGDLDRINDMESIFTAPNGDLYLMASQTAKANGKVAPAKTLLVRVRRDGTLLRSMKTIAFRPALLKGLKASKVAELKALRDEWDGELEIEASFLRDGDLYVGLKRPLDDQKRSLVLNVGPLDQIMGTGTVDPNKVNVWKTIRFPVEAKKGVHMTDMIALDGNRFVISTVNKGDEAAGRVWMFDARSEEPLLMQEYPGFHPEGLAYDPGAGELMVFFDQNEEGARFAKIRISGQK